MCESMFNLSINLCLNCLYMFEYRQNIGLNVGKYKQQCLAVSSVAYSGAKDRCLKCLYMFGYVFESMFKLSLCV